MVKIRVQNVANNGVTVNLKDFNDKIIPITGKSFALLTEEELTYVMNTSKIFETGSLQVANKEALSSDIDLDSLKSPNTFTDEDILALLKKTQKQVEVSLENVTNPDVVKRILAKAQELDKSVKVVEAIQLKLESLLS